MKPPPLWLMRPQGFFVSFHFFFKNLESRLDTLYGRAHHAASSFFFLFVLFNQSVFWLVHRKHGRHYLQYCGSFRQIIPCICQWILFCLFKNETKFSLQLHACYCWLFKMYVMICTCIFPVSQIWEFFHQLMPSFICPNRSQYGRHRNPNSCYQVLFSFFVPVRFPTPFPIQKYCINAHFTEVLQLIKA